MSAIPNLRIPVTVVTDQVAPAMKKVENDIAASAARISKSKALLMPSLGALGAGPLGGVLGALGTQGGALAGIGLGAGAIAAPFLAVSKLGKVFEDASKGATDALDKFKQTGEQTVAANSVILERLARIEQQAKQLPGGMGQAFVAASAGGAEGSLLQDIPSYWQQRSREAAGFAGAFLGGKGLEMSQLEAQLAVASDAEAARIQRRMNEVQRIQQTEEVGWDQPLSMLTDAILKNSMIMEKIYGAMK